jgi:hypothetical protein
VPEEEGEKVRTVLIDSVNNEPPVQFNGSGSQWLANNRGSPDSSLCQPVWDFWWSKWLGRVCLRVLQFLPLSILLILGYV